MTATRQRRDHEPPVRSRCRAGWALLLLLPALAGCRVNALLYPAPGVAVPSPPPPPFEESLLALADGTRVHAWQASAARRSPREPALLYFHGNGENLETMRRAGLLEDLLALDRDVLAIDYPGYGRSGGRPSEAGTAAAAAAALARLEERRPGAGVIAIGWSLGAAVAVRLAAENPGAVRGLVALSPWSSLDELARIHFPGFLVALLLRERYDSLAAAPRVEAPALVVHGARDGIIPPAHGRRLAEALAAARHVEVRGAGHNDLLGHGEVWLEVRRFLDAPGS